MKKRFTRILSLVFVVIMMMTMLTACGGSGGSYNDALGDADYGAMDSMGSVSSNNGFGDIWQSDSKAEYEPEANPESGEPEESEGVDSARKIIERIRLSVQTKDFDNLMNAVDARIKDFNGYIESSDIYGNGYDSYDYGDRSARMVVRIPCAKAESFINFVSDNGAVTNKTVETEDVTLQYVDVESRISVLLLEKESLEELLQQATTMEDIIYVREKLMDVIYELESSQRQLRTFDNLIDYTTITLNIYEVERTVIVEKQTAWEEIATKFTNNIEDIKEWCVRFFIEVVGNSPILAINFACLAVLIIVIRKASRKAKAKADAARMATMNAGSDTQSAPVANDEQK